MAEIIPDPRNKIHQTPMSLKELSVITVSLGIWRREIRKHRDSSTLDNFYYSSVYISLEVVLPHLYLPSAMNDLIEKYIEMLRLSIGKWLRDHQFKICKFYHHIFNYFDDLVGDHNGTINYGKTAKRMIHCEQFNVVERFKIACMYCFEDEIRRIWSSLSENATVNNFPFVDHPLVFYWIRYFKNALHEIPTSENETVDEAVFTKSLEDSLPSVEYFWNRIPSENQMRMVRYFFADNEESFAWYILPKLNDQQLNEFVNENGLDFMIFLMKDHYIDEMIVLPAWMCIRNFMNEDAFINLILVMLQFEVYRRRRDLENYEFLEHEYSYAPPPSKNWLRLCCQVYVNAPNNLKQATIRHLTSNSDVFDYYWASIDDHSFPKGVKFLMTIFSSASRPIENKNALWRNCWLHRIGNNLEDLQRMLKSCFENKDENEINPFKENVTANYEIIRRTCFSLLGGAFFDQLNEFVAFLCPDTETARRFKQQVLRLFLLGEDCCFDAEIFIKKSTQFNGFINDAFNDADLSADFRNQLMSSRIIQHRLSRVLLRSFPNRVKEFMKFIDVFASTEEILLQIKMRIVHFMDEWLNNQELNHRVHDQCFSDRFLLWCLGSEEEVGKFRSTYPSRLA